MNYRDELEAGRDAFGHLIKVWHERNGWSQRVLPALAERLELGRVHNSQLSNLRNRKLTSPGPELFVALGRINELLAAQGPAGLSPELEQQISELSVRHRHGLQGRKSPQNMKSNVSFWYFTQSHKICAFECPLVNHALYA